MDSLLQTIKDSIKVVPNDIIQTSILQESWTNNDKWTFAIAVLALLISIGLGLYQLKLSRKQLLMDLKLDRFESQKGEVQLLSIIIRFFISFNSAWDISNPKNAQLKKDIVSIKQFIIESNTIAADLNTLINNPFYIGLIEKHPIIVKTVVQLRRDIVDQEIKSQNNLNDFALSSESFTNFYDLFYLLKSEQKNSDIFKRELITELETMLTNLVESNDKLLIRR